MSWCLQHSSFLALQAWWSSVAEALAAAEALDVQLCVGNKADSIPHHPAQAAAPPDSGEGAAGALEEQRRGYMEWCLDRGFEYIEASALDAGFDASKRHFSASLHLHSLAQVESPYT